MKHARTVLFLAVPAVLLLVPALACASAADPWSAAAAAAPESSGASESMTRWSPYLVGGLIGVLSWFTFVLSNRPLGMSTAYAITAGMIERAIRGDKVLQRPYYKEYPPVIGWGWMLAVGVLLGGFLSALLSGDFELEVVPPLWQEHFGYTPWTRLTVAFLGGMMIGMGARWADGCTSGHGISGALQLLVTSWVAVACFFIGGTITAMLIFRPFH